MFSKTERIKKGIKPLTDGWRRYATTVIGHDRLSVRPVKTLPKILAGLQQLMVLHERMARVIEIDES